MKILGIETSCDETAAAIVINDRQVLSSVVSSQVDVHHLYGGVVPELASRKHIEAIVPVFRQALNDAGIHLHEIDGIAVTRGPGLVGSLLVGFSFAKSLAMALDRPWVGVSHLEGHVNSVFLEPNPPPFPFLALLVSGGHTSIYYVTSHTEISPLGQTRDDAAGEAFDKVAKMLGMGYPGGGAVSRQAQQGDSQKINFTRPYLKNAAYDFSFSGIKTAVNRCVSRYKDQLQDWIPHIAAGFQEAVVEVLVYKILKAAVDKDCEHIALVGGVAANRRLREKLRSDARRRGMKVYIPSIELCGDNAAMIAGVGYHYLINGVTSNLSDDVYSRQKH